MKEANSEYKEADELFSEAADLVDGTLVNVPTPTNESSLVGTMSEIYVRHFQLAVSALEDNNKAFEIVERARSRGMTDALRDHRRVRAEAVSDTNPAEVAITDLQRQLRQQQTSVKRNKLLGDLDKAEAKLAGSEYQHHQLCKLVPLKPVPLNVFEGSLEPDEVVLEYVLGDPHSFCLVITHRSAMVQTLASRTQINSAVERYLTEVNAKRPANTDANHLYSWLLSGCLAGLSQHRLVVIPDGKLNEIPFGALMDPAGHYVAETHVVSVATSSTVLIYVAA